MVAVSTGEYLIKLLELYDVDYVFGIPGVHTVELYRGLAQSPIQHITPRHEQGAGFMADGYARMSGKPGVCLVITGPGLSNIATAALQACADSIPMLIISGVNDPDRDTRGHLHEMPDQSAFAKAVAVESITIQKPAELEGTIVRAFQIFEMDRPGPVHIEVPLSVMQEECAGLVLPTSRAQFSKPDLPDGLLDQAVELIDQTQVPVILAGGGAYKAADQVLALAEKLQAPLLTTINARSFFPAGHKLVISASASLKVVRDYMEQADLIIAIGTEFGPTDFDMYELGSLPQIKKLIRIDICTEQLSRNYTADINLAARAEDIVPLLIEKSSPKNTNADEQVKQLHQASWQELPAAYRGYINLLKRLNALEEGIIFVGDSTQLVYAGNLYFKPKKEGRWFNSSTGYGTLGYALPAALGAKLAQPESPVIVLVGDGGLQFTLSELGTLRDLGYPVIVIVWNNNGYGEIKTYMEDHDVIPEGVDLIAPDFAAIAAAYGVPAIKVTGEGELVRTVSEALQNNTSLVVDMIVQ